MNKQNKKNDYDKMEKELEKRLIKREGKQRKKMKVDSASVKKLQKIIYKHDS